MEKVSVRQSKYYLLFIERKSHTHLRKRKIVKEFLINNLHRSVEILFKYFDMLAWCFKLTVKLVRNDSGHSSYSAVLPCPVVRTSHNFINREMLVK